MAKVFQEYYLARQHACNPRTPEAENSKMIVNSSLAWAMYQDPISGRGGNNKPKINRDLQEKKCMMLFNCSLQKSKGK